MAADAASAATATITRRRPENTSRTLCRMCSTRCHREARLSHLSFEVQVSATRALPRYAWKMQNMGLRPLRGVHDTCELGLLRVDHFGDDLPAVPLRGLNRTACRQACATDPACAGMVHIKAGCGKMHPECWLKGGALIPTHSVDPCHCMESGLLCGRLCVLGSSSA
mmetsp:Transcript_168318/g.540767  ORF Transcript_168318/g.540767 Transcript_168318/m.540767 type:complete len:167 (-) Transcript_168318:305-805(-)